ncbi:neuroglian-like [Paramacrobiotus metropolitanus]|uniref:neuroglian-like n=1 Tax=Paramacrobiotus metropolitanus TaxID=2943436 RepID=UPI002445CCED|nr:neuroglian-like [Paramacrobiotus metropolitanus]XP_055330094.1 neuroglian-like [Paramacrobiotus metropolitanus]
MQRRLPSSAGLHAGCLTVFAKFIAPLLLFLISSGTSARAGTSPPYMVRGPPQELLYKSSNPYQEDRPIVLDCEAKGDPVPEYKWIKNGQEFSVSVSDDRIAQEPGKGTLTIHRPKDIDEGLYQCRAENFYGISLSNAVYLRRAGLDTFQGGDSTEEIVVDEGQALTIKCYPPVGIPRPNVFWTLQSPNGAITTVNGSRISVDPEGALHFSNVTLRDASGEDTYGCSVFSPFLREYKTGQWKKLIVKPSRSAAPNKASPVLQYTSPKNLTGMLGRFIDISCIYGGTPLPEIRWERENAPLPRRRHFLTDFGKVLRIKHLTFEDQGTYKCIASNGIGEIASHVFTLTVESLPYWIVEPERVTKAEDENHEFVCMAGGIPEPRIQWFVNGTPIENVARTANRVINGNNITLTRVQKDVDTDNYQCNASNAHGYIFADVFINVMAMEASITEPPAALSEAVEGALITITCRPYGAPQPIVSWDKDGQILVSAQLGNGSRYEIQRSGDLLINGSHFDDSGYFTCEARNRFGMQRASGRLDIKKKTKITMPPGDIERNAGDSATFRCSASSDPNLEVLIEWARDDEPIKPSESGRIFLTNDNSLIITDAQEVDSGLYKCIARTRLDRVEATASLLVRDVPNPPLNVKAQCERRYATVSWEHGGDNRDPVFEYIIQYSTSFEPDVWDDLKSGIHAGTFSESIELSPWVNYTFRVKAFSAVGLSNASAPSQEACTTPPDVPYKNPDNIQGRGDTPNNLIISWTPMPEIDHNGPGFYYEVKYTRADPDPHAQRIEEIIIIKDWRQNNVTIVDQPTYVPYDVQVMANNAVGHSRAWYGPPVRGFSGEDRPTTAPGNPQVQKLVDGRTAEISWSPVPADSINGEFKGYKIKVTPEGEKTHREIRVASYASSAVVDVLKPASANTIRVLAYNGQYDGPASDEIVIQTGPMPPGRPADFRAYPMGRGAIFLQWKEPTEPNGRLTHYEIVPYTVEGLMVSQPIRKAQNVPLHINDLKFSGLTPDTMYRIYLYAVNDKGRGEPEIVEAATEPNRTSAALPLLPPPGTPEYLVIRKTNDSLILAWQPHAAAAEGDRTGEYFYVQYKRAGDKEWKSSGSVMDSLQTEIQPLEPATTYDIRVVAVEASQETPGPTGQETTLLAREGEMAPGANAVLRSAGIVK